MEYTIQKLAKLAGVTSRTLRYYDEIGILKPARMNSSGYRIYSQKEVDLLQQILFYRELDLDLEAIGKIIHAPAFDEVTALQEHRDKLLTKKKRLEGLIKSVDMTLAAKEGSITMSDQEKFEAFKQNLIDDNEQKYGAEIRTKYGEETIDKSNAKLKGMSKEKYEQGEKLGQEVLQVLHEAFQTGDPTSPLAQKAAELHRQWLSFYWDSYSKEAHAGLAQMYVDDERFTAYYDKQQPGTAAFLRDAVFLYTGTKKK
ncbi:HTH-type transcriptional activator TipA [Bacillus sp. THAF10]|uniref:MerR family transcriptional regulator n=1 Tax=Bacillus sp. THAF10 TaxID=2587848 RepID=UPI0012685C4E|nr:MerR family transcriptional regulator [Bacillus sp. THAF10]QFT87285.1 HTH-type transcriptional activator TipA [Bacillus sp. THAF10]